MATATLTLSRAEIAQIPSPSLPIGPQISHLLSEFTSLSIQLFTILSSPSSASTTALTTPIYLSLSSLDQKLSSLLSLLAQHQQKQSRINSLVSSLRTLDESWHSSASTLHSCISSLDPIISSGALDRSSISLASNSTLTSESLLSYARLLAPFTSAPPSSLYPPNEKLRGIGATDPTGRSLPIGAIPPFPTEGVMRRGRLQFGRDEGLGTTNEIGGKFALSSLNLSWQQELMSGCAWLQRGKKDKIYMVHHHQSEQTKEDQDKIRL